MKDRIAIVVTGCWVALFTLCAVISPARAAKAADSPPAAKNPHGDYQEDCSLCHSAKGWKPVRISNKFDHGRFLPLVGAHASVKCTQCHKSLDFAMAPTACVDCHADVHNGELGADCARCHGTRSFVDRNDHIRLHRATRFPLAGAHTTLDCEMCHRLSSPDANTYVNTPTDCSSCHMPDYQATTDPDHEAVGFPTDCTQCHDQFSFSRASFDHAVTGFGLTGAHAPLACDRCHMGGVFTGLSPACASCHQNDYDGTHDPAHAAAGFSTDCTQCHNTSRWSDAFFNHNGTQFPLTGAHRGVACGSCHAGGVYNGLSTACIACHQNDYDGTNDPPHASSGFPTNCTQCHSTTSWSGADFNHSATSFPLTGAHLSASCNSCHGGGVYNGLPTACVSCHQNDYDGTNDPNHAAAHFPTDCTQCHNTTGWSGANFNHASFFPINSGVHAGKWSSCNVCHTNAANYDDFSCFGCHPHSDKTKTDNDHGGRNGYSYDSQACYDCHPNGRS
jgi:hypothetical protein